MQASPYTQWQVTRGSTVIESRRGPRYDEAVANWRWVRSNVRCPQEGKETPMASVKEILVQEVERLSEEDALRVLELLRTEKTASVRQRPKLTREELIRRAAGRPGIHVPDPDAPPFEKVEPIETRGVPASQMLIADRR
jgi:hypothetical protein